MQPIVGANVEPSTQIHSDEFGETWRMEEYEHSIVDHLHTYIDGNVDTKGMENFWSLLKRTIGGTYVSVELFHLFRYVDEHRLAPPNERSLFHQVRDLHYSSYG
jgi:ISXO2-like transposase domain